MTGGTASLKDAADGASQFASSVGETADRVGNGAPTLTLAIVAGIGFLAGMAGRRH